MPLDVAALRADTPGCEHVVHLNNAGAALMPAPVLDAVVDHLRLEARIGGYEAADAAEASIATTYDAVAELIGAGRDEIALVESATRGWDLAFYALQFEAGDRILTSQTEYASNVIALLQVARRTGAVIEVVPDDETGQVDVAELERRIDDRTRLVALTHVPAHNGLVNPAAEVGALARAAGVPYLLDACQSVGQMPVDVEEIGCDFLSATSRKFLRGPRGAGFLYVREDWLERLEPPVLDMRAATWAAPDEVVVRSDARRFESWEAAQAVRIGFGTAVRYALDLGLDAIEARVTALAEDLRGRLAALEHLEVHDRGLRRSAIVTFSDRRRPAPEVADRLRSVGINVSVALPEQARYDFAARDLPSMVRASVHCYNDDEDLQRLVDACAET